MIKKFEKFKNEDITDVDTIEIVFSKLRKTSECNETNESFKIGTKVIYNGRMFSDKNGQEATVVGYKYGNIIKFKDGTTNYGCSDNCLTIIEEPKERTRIRRPDIDPFDEEDWGYIQESADNEDFKVGDIVELSDERKEDLRFRIPEFLRLWVVGKVIDIYKIGIDYNIKVDWNGDITTHLPTSLKLLKNRTKIRRPDIDPFDEEDWGYVQD